jgi:hypothetical protein
MVSKGSNMSRFHGDRDSAVSLVSQLLCKKPVVLEIQSELNVEKRRLDHTAAGSYVSENMEDLKVKYEEELVALERLKQDLLESDRAMKRQLQKDWDNEIKKLKDVQQEQVNLQRPVDQEVREEIKNAKKKKSGLAKLLPFIPAVINILGMFVGIPPGVTSLLTSWFSEFGVDFGDDFGSC